MTCKQTFIQRHAPNHGLKRLPERLTEISRRDWDERNSYVVKWWEALPYADRIILKRVPKWLRDRQ